MIHNDIPHIPWSSVIFDHYYDSFPRLEQRTNSGVDIMHGIWSPHTAHRIYHIAGNAIQCMEVWSILGATVSRVKRKVFAWWL